ncbi:NAD(+) diphosphatase [Intestinibacter sp.]
MNNCYECGEKLGLKKDNEGTEVQYCESCGAFRYPIFNTAMSTAIVNKSKDKVILIKQYGKDDYILVAGYVNKGESVEQTVAREVKEELRLDIINCEYMRSEYFEKSNTLMLNFISVVEDEDLSKISDEVDKATWFSFDDARKNIKKGSLAEKFLIKILEKLESAK